MNNVPTLRVSEKSVINNSGNYGKPEERGMKMDKKTITALELAMVVGVSEKTIKANGKRLFGIEDNFNSVQSQTIQDDILHPFSKRENEINKVLETTADNWITKVLGV